MLYMGLNKLRKEPDLYMKIYSEKLYDKNYYASNSLDEGSMPDTTIASLSEGEAATYETEEEVLSKNLDIQDEQEDIRSSEYISNFSVAKSNNESTFNQKKQKKNNYYSAVNDLILLSKAEKAGQVRAIKSRLLSKAVQIGKSGLDPEEMTVLLSQIRKVIRKADKKLSRLQAEEKMEARSRKAEIKNQVEEAKKIKEDLKQRIRRRKQDEENDIINEMKKESINNRDQSFKTMTFSPICIYNESVYESAVIEDDSSSVDIFV